MANLTLHTSNQQEVLSQKLASWLVKSPLSDPFTRETIVVQSLGMRRWLQLEIARHLGICTQIDFPFPQSFLRSLLEKCLPNEIIQNTAFARETLRWRIYAWLQNHIGERPSEIAPFLADDPTGVKCWQLASHTAQIFDDYSAYRPDWLIDWQKSARPGWQETIWHDLARDYPENHLPALLQRFTADLNLFPLENLPPRLAVFGLATLPPAYLHLLSALSHRVPVDLFVLQPTDQFWGDLETEREIARRRKRGLPMRSEAITWNPLLASLGKTGRDYFTALWKIEHLEDDSEFVDPTNSTLLGRLQASLMDPERPSPQPLADDPSQSIQIHSCPGPMREVEIFRDRLLALFEQFPDLQPRDVLVMTPDLDTYAPMIEAVFGSQESVNIPYSLADRTTGNPHTPAAVLLALLELASSRVTVPEVMAFLEIPPIREKLELSLADLEIIQNWTHETGIRWGFDAAHRASLGLPAFGENSWQFGLDRLLLGFTMPPPESGVHAGIAPVSVRDKTSADILGKICGLIEWLRQFHLSLQTPRPLAEWSNELRRRLDYLLLPGSLPTFDPTTTVLEQMRETGAWLDSSEPLKISADILREYLALALSVDETQVGYLNGGVTFCACRPMRSIPARVIAMLGLNDGEFPRRALPSQLDLMAKDPRQGDRSRREDDRYLFLETILSARDILYLSYIGRSAQNGTELLPSSLVSELGDYLDAQFATQEKWSSRLLIQHPLHGFSPTYFLENGQHLFSYSQTQFETATNLLGTKKPVEPWFQESLPDLQTPLAATLNEFVRFFQNPAAFFLQKRLGLTFKTIEEDTDDTEPFEINPLVRYQLRDDGLRHPGSSLTKWQAEGNLTPGEKGRALALQIESEAEAFLTKLAPYLAEKSLDDIPFELPISSLLLSGQITDLRANGLLITQHGTIRSKHLLNAWIKHLILNSQTDRIDTRLIGRDESLCFKALPSDEALACLSTLGTIFTKGLNRPLPFFPETSHAWQNNSANPHKQPSAAQKAWFTTGFNRGEDEDLSFKQCFSHLADPFDAEFIALAAEIFKPLLKNLGEQSDAS